MAAHRARPRRGRRALGLVGIAMIALGALLAGPGLAAGQEPTGKVRLGHLSPTTPAVDVYLSGPGGMSTGTPIVQAAGYGAVTQYESLAPGRYTVAMRPAGADPATAPALTAGFEVTAGAAQSLLFFDNGPNGAVQGQLVNDDLTPPDVADGKVRIVQGVQDAPPVQMLADGGPQLASDLTYGSVTAYTTVQAKQWRVRLSSGRTNVTTTLAVTGGSVSTVVLSKDANGGFALRPLADVSGLPVGAELAPEAKVPQGAPQGVPGRTPAGGVPAGGGGTAGGPGVLPAALLLGGAVALVFATSAAGTGLRRRRRA